MLDAGRLAEIVGAERFVFGFPTEAAANGHAARRMAEGRTAVTYRDGDVFVCVYGVKPRAAHLSH